MTKKILVVDDESNIHFINELHKDLPEIFYSIDNLDTLQKEAIKQEILVIDDTTHLYQFLKDGFQDITDDYIITGVMSGVECFDLLASDYTPHLILLNMSMADNKGHEIISRLKHNPLWRDISILLIKGDKERFHQGSLDVYIQDYITKSYALSELKTKIDTILLTKKSRGLLHV